MMFGQSDLCMKTSTLMEYNLKKASKKKNLDKKLHSSAFWEMIS